MATNLFQKIAQAGQALGVVTRENVNKAREWYRMAAQSLKGITANDIMAGDMARLLKQKTIGAKQIGQMLLFFYDAKTKEKLPYYDKYPLTFPIELYNDGFLGINLHYLPPPMRGKLFAQLETLTQDKDDKRKLKISYGILKGASSMNAFRPCIKRYLYKHVRSRYYIVRPEEWKFVVFLPSERFVAGGKIKGRGIDSPYSKDKVWADSMRMINKNKPRKKGK